MHSSSSQIQYHRLQAELKNDSLDDARPEVLEGLIHAAAELLKSAEFEDVYQTLKNCFIERNAPLKERIQDLDQHTHLSLQHLWFSDLDWEPFSRALNSTQHLTYVTLRRCGIKAERIQPICEGLAQHKNLTYLDLSENDIKEGIYDVGILISEHNSIQGLNLTRVGITSEHRQPLRQLLRTPHSRRASSLKALSLSDNPLGAEIVYSLLSQMITLPKASFHTLLLEGVELTIQTKRAQRFWSQQFDALAQVFSKDGFCSLYGNNIDRELKSTLHKQHTPTLNFYTSFTLKENLS